MRSLAHAAQRRRGTIAHRGSDHRAARYSCSGPITAPRAVAASSRHMRGLMALLRLGRSRGRAPPLRRSTAAPQHTNRRSLGRAQAAARRSAHQAAVPHTRTRLRNCKGPRTLHEHVHKTRPTPRSEAPRERRRRTQPHMPGDTRRQGTTQPLVCVLPPTRRTCLWGGIRPAHAPHARGPREAPQDQNKKACSAQDHGPRPAQPTTALGGGGSS